MYQYEDIAIAHIPRTGGDLCNFLIYQRLRSELTKHFPPFQSKAFQPKKYYLLIRRLPNWFLSYVMMGVQCGVYPHFKKWPKPTPDELFDLSSGYGEKYIGELVLKGPILTLGDRYIEHFLEGENPPLTGVIRLEFIARDLGKVLGCKIEIPKGVPGKLNLKYNRKLFKHWTEKQIASLYKANPKWASLERKDYP